MTVYMVAVALLMAPGLGQNDEHNAFIHFAHQMKTRMPALQNMTCWVGSLIPASSENSFPIVPTPLTPLNVT